MGGGGQEERGEGGGGLARPPVREGRQSRLSVTCVIFNLMVPDLPLLRPLFTTDRSPCPGPDRRGARARRGGGGGGGIREGGGSSQMDREMR